MAKVSYDLRDFSAGTITNGDPVDIPDGAATYSLNVSSLSGIGEITSVVENTEIMAGVPHITSMIVQDGLETGTFDLAVNIDTFFILIDDYSSDKANLQDFLKIIEVGQLLSNVDPSTWSASGGSTSGGKKWIVIETTPNFTYEISGSIDVSHTMDTVSASVRAIVADTNADGTAADTQGLTGVEEKGGAFTCIKDKTFKHDFVASSNHTVILLENGESSDDVAATTSFLSGIRVQYGRGGYIWGDLGEELDFTSTARGLFIASDTDVPHVQHKQRDTVNNVVKQYLEKSECLSPNASNAINNIDQMAWVTEAGGRTKLICAVYGVNKLWECVLNDAGATDYYEFMPSDDIQGLTTGIGGLLQSDTPKTVYSWDFEGFTVHKLEIEDGSSNIPSVGGGSDTWDCVVKESYTLNLEDCGDNVFIMDIDLGVADTDKMYILFGRMGGLQAGDIILASIDITSGGNKSVANGDFKVLYEINGFNHLSAFTGSEKIYRTALFWDYLADVNPTGMLDFYWPESSPEQPLNYVDGDYASRKSGPKVSGGEDVCWINTKKEAICLETKAGGLAVTNHISANHDCCWFTLEPNKEGQGTQWLKYGGVWRNVEQYPNYLGLTEATSGFFYFGTPDGHWTEQLEKQIITDEKMLVAVVPQDIALDNKTIKEFAMDVSPAFGASAVAQYDACLVSMNAMEDVSWPTEKQSGPFIHDYWELENILFLTNLEGGPGRGRDDGGDHDDKRKAYPEKKLSIWWPTGWGWHKRTKKKWGITIKYWWWGATGWAWTNPKTHLADERDISSETMAQVDRIRNIHHTAEWQEVKAALREYRTEDEMATPVANLLKYMNAGVIEVFVKWNQTTWVDPLRDIAYDGAILSGFQPGEPWGAWNDAWKKYNSLTDELIETKMAAFKKQTHSYPQGQIRHFPMVSNSDMPASWAQFQGYEDAGGDHFILGSLNDAGKFKHSEGKLDFTAGSGNLSAFGTTTVTWQDRHTGNSSGVFTTTVPGTQGPVTVSEEDQDVTEGWTIYKPTDKSIQTRAASGDDGNADEGLIVTMYTGDLTLTQFNFADTPALADGSVASIFDAGDIKVGLYLADEPDDGDEETANFVSGDTWLYNMSFLYDGYQEGPLMATPVTIGPLTGDSTYLEIGVRFQLTNPRITHVQIYRKTDVTLKYRLLKSVEIDTEWDIKQASDPAAISEAHDVAMHSVIDFVTKDTGSEGISYEALTGLPETLKSTMVNYAESESIGNYLFVTAATHPKLIDTDKMIFRSQPGKFSMFNWAVDYLGLPEAPHTLISANNRLFAFSNKTMFRIDPYNMILEQEYLGMGIPGKRSVAVIDGLMYIGNKNGIYVHTGGNFTKISQTIDDKYLKYWAKFPNMRVTLANDKKYNSLLVMFDNLGSQSIDIVPNEALVYSIDKRRWDIWILPRPVKAHCINENNELMICAAASTIKGVNPNDGAFLSESFEPEDSEDLDGLFPDATTPDEVKAAQVAYNIANRVDDKEWYSLYTLHTNNDVTTPLEWSTKTVTMNAPSRRKKLKSIKLWGDNVTIGSIESDDGHLFFSTDAIKRAQMGHELQSYPYTQSQPLANPLNDPAWAVWGGAECIISTEYSYNGSYAASLDRAVHTDEDEVETVIWDKADFPDITNDDWRLEQKKACEAHQGYWIEEADGTYLTSAVIREFYKTANETSRPYKHSMNYDYQFWRFTGDSKDSFTAFDTTSKGFKIHIHSTENYSAYNQGNKTPVLRGISVTYRDKTLK